MATYPSISMLPMTDIKNELLTDKFKADFGASVDTQTVSGVAADKIAIATPTVYEDVPDIATRDTVKNALYLNGIPANNYMCIDKNNTLIKQTEAATTIQRDDTLALRDELYRLYASLIRKGIISDDGVSYGFQDNFLNSQIKCLENNMCAVHDSMLLQLPISTILPASSGFLHVGELFIAAVYNSVTDTYLRSFLLRVQNIVVSNELDNVTFTEINDTTPFTLEPLAANETLKLFKVQGIYNNYTFTYGAFEENLEDVSTYTSSLLDYYMPIMVPLTQEVIGYATTITVHEDSLGFNENGIFKTFSVAAKRIGTPGALRCYVVQGIDFTDITSIPTLLEHEKLKAYSNYVAAENIPANTTQFVTFDLKTPDNDYFTIQSDNIYTVIIIAESCDDNNTWQLRFGQSNTGDLQTNRTCFSFQTGEGLKEYTEKRDLICYAVTSELPTLTLTPYQNGIYTSKDFNIYTKDLSKARLSMHIKKENTYVSSNAMSQFIKKGDRIKLLGDISLSTFNTGDTIVIGHSIATVVSVTIQSSIYIVLDKDVFLEANASVYKINYYPNLILHYQDLTKANEESIYTFPLKLVGVETYAHATFSDLLFFECDLPVTDLTLTYGNIQVGWNTEHTNCEGAINNLSLAFAKGYIEEV